MYAWAIALTIVVGGGCSDDETDNETTGEGAAGAGATSANGGAGGDGGDGGDAQCDGSTSTADCATYCTGVVAAACPGGPTQQECEQGCQMQNDNVAQCPAWGALVDCAETAGSFICFMGETVPEGCEAEFYCLSQCFN